MSGYFALENILVDKMIALTFRYGEDRAHGLRGPPKAWSTKSILVEVSSGREVGPWSRVGPHLVQVSLLQI